MSGSSMMQMSRACLVAAFLFPAVYSVQMRSSSQKRRDDPLATTYCTEEVSIEVAAERMVYSNLGGLGAPKDQSMPHSMLFDHVIPELGEQVNMVVTPVGPYFPGNHENGVHGDMGKLGVAAGSNATLAFHLRQMLEPKKLTAFMFTIGYLFGNGDQQKSVKVCGYDQYVVSDTSILEVVMDDGDCVELRSTGRHSDVELPSLLRVLDQKQLDAAVAFLFHSRADFQVTFHMDAGFEAGTFLWGGQSNLVCQERAMCNTYKCPKFFQLRPNAARHYCGGSVCHDNPDRNGCCEMAVPNTCEPDMTMLFASGALRFSNLGGLGPDFHKPAAMVFSNIFPGQASVIDLWVTAVSQYEPSNASMSGQFGNFGCVNVKDGTSVDLLFQFKRRGRESKSLDINFPFSFSILDFDMGAQGGSVEMVSYAGPLVYELTNATKIKVHKEVTPRGRELTTFIATEAGNALDNPANPVNLSTDQLDRSVTFQFKPMNEFRIRFTVGESNSPSVLGGRNFMFSGWTTTSCSDKVLCLEYVCPPGLQHKELDSYVACEGEDCNIYDDDRCCEPTRRDICAWENALYFKEGSMLLDNLGARGPDNGAAPIMFISSVHPGLSDEKNPVDLLVFAEGEYNPGDVLLNGLDKGMLHISVKSGSTMNLRFSFVDRSTQRLTAVDKFYFTLLDFEGATSSNGQFVCISNYDSYNISEHSLLSAANLEDGSEVKWVKFTTSAVSDAKDDPQNPISLLPHQRARSATVFFSQQSKFVMSFHAAGGQEATHFILAGRSNSICPAPESCASYSCPANSVLVPFANTVPCREGCTLEECCVSDNREECFKERIMSFEEAKVSASNLGGLGPDTGAHKLVFENVFPYIGDDIVNLEITAGGSYTPGDVSFNALGGLAGNINVANGTETTFHFKLVNATYPGAEVVRAVPFWLTFMDIIHESPRGEKMTEDEALPSLRASHPAGAPSTLGRTRKAPPKTIGGGRMYVSTADAATYELDELSSLASTNSSDGRMTFYAGSFGIPSPLAEVAPQQFTLRGVQKSSSVSLKFNTSEFSVTLGVEAGTEAPKNFKFTGLTNSLCASRAVCSSYLCPADYHRRAVADQIVCRGAVCTDIDRDVCCELEECDPTRDLRFAPDSLVRSNLGGYGPDENWDEESLVFENVFPLSNSSVNLVVKTAGHYYPHNVSRNGLTGVFGQMNLKAGSSTVFRFSFVDSHTKDPVKVPSFLFSFFDIDQQHVDGEEVVSINNYEWLATTPRTELQLEAEGTVRSSAFGDYVDNPTNPRSMPASALNRTVTYLIDSCANFEVSVEVTQGFAGRNIIFGGSSNIVCPARANCLSMECPYGFRSVPENANMLCGGPKCRDIVEDVETCCEEVSQVKRPVQAELRSSTNQTPRPYADERRENGIGVEPVPKFLLTYPEEAPGTPSM